jgi:formylglycine-generating enzyme required for sulfatase activity
MRILFLLACLSLLPALAAAQCCCCLKRDAGQTAYNNGNYETAIAKWQEGKKCSDAASCTDLDGLIANARSKIKQRDAAAAEQRRQREAEAERQRKAEQKRLADKADDDAWDLVKDSQDPKTVQKYLDKYPSGRHATDARKRLKELSPATTTPAEKPKTSAMPSHMVFVQGGTFSMGDQFGDGSDDEKSHTVTVNDFYISKYEVTFDEFDAFCTATGREKPSDRDWGRGRRPVIYVDWYDALEYCNWLSQKENLTPVYTIDKNKKDPNNSNEYDTKKWTVSRNSSANGYCLPTEAEWEYAARERGKKVRFGNGRDVIDPSEINFDARSTYKKPYSVVGEYRQKTVPVDDLSANSLGLKNMSGNVWEWCWDWYGDKYYKQSDGARNPSGPSSGSYRVVRGGGWSNIPENCRAVTRNDWDPNNRNGNVGFRVARH